MKKITLLALFIIHHSMFVAKAQTTFIAKGKIEYEKKVNMHKEIDSWIDDEQEGGMDWLGDMKKKVPQFQLSYYNMVFADNKTVYQPGRELPRDPSVPDWFNGAANDNIVYNDRDADKSISQKTVFDNIFLIADSSRSMDWRITSELRKIAGFECHKAVGRIMDSVYVIAFYTDQITTSGGPESFCGLPGMILGLAIPRLNTTWFATKLELTDVKPTDLQQPKKGKKVNNSELLKQLQTSMKDWGKNWQRNVWKVML